MVDCEFWQFNTMKSNGFRMGYKYIHIWFNPLPLLSPLFTWSNPKIVYLSINPICLHKRPCLNELQKEYCVKIKLRALDWKLLTQISWCQMNREVVMCNVEGNFFWNIFLKKFNVMSWKTTQFDIFLWSIFKSPVFTFVFLLIKIMIPLYFKHVWLRVDLFFALQLPNRWFYFGFGFCKWKTRKK